MEKDTVKRSTVNKGTVKVHEFEDVGKILSRWLSRNRVKERLSETSIYSHWKEIVGEEIASNTRVVRFQGGVLTVEVSSAPLLNELATYHKEEILESIRERKEFRGVQEIRFRAGVT